MSHFGYMTDLQALKFDDQSLTHTFMAFPFGKYDHPMYGKIEFTPTMASEIATNVNSGVRGQDLDIDYDHKLYGGEAAGWVKNAEARGDGLWLTVEWTKKAFGLIKEKAYRYFSPEYKDEWKHPKTGTVHKNVLFGGGITNRPFLKDILPLNLSELYAEQKEGTGMDPKEMRKLLGLPEDATEEQVNTALQERLKEPPKETDDEKVAREKAEADAAAAADEKKNEPVLVGLTEEAIKRLSESGNADVKALAEVVSALNKTVSTQGVALQLAETANVVKKFAEPNKENIALSTASQEKLKGILLKADKPVFDAIVSLMETVTGEGGTVQLGETEGITRGDHDTGNSGDAATKKFNDAVQASVEKDKLSYGDAVERVASQHPDLFEAHRKASYSFREN